MKTNTPTLQHLAEVCGVTVMTVYRALRPGLSVAPGTLAAALAAVEPLGYHQRLNLGRPRSRSATPRLAVEIILGDHRQATCLQALLAAISQELAARNRDCEMTLGHLLS